jgi:hypothetical protein
MSGHVPVRFINASPGKLCGLHARTRYIAGGTDAARSWVGKPIGQGEAIEFRVRPDTYEFSVRVCVGDFSSSTSTARPIRIDRAMEIVFGDTSVAPARGVRRVKATFPAIEPPATDQDPEQMSCTPSEEFCDGARPCCEGYACVRVPNGDIYSTCQIR